MADATFMPPEPPLPEVRGGRYRPSQLVQIDRFPEVRRRLDLNQLLLERTCPFDSPQEAPRFDDVLDLLLRTVGERFGAETALLRYQAVVALGTVDADEAVQRLTELAITPVENDAIRIAALVALPRERFEELAERLAEDLSPAVASFVREMREGPSGRPRVPGHVPFDREAKQNRLDECDPHCG